jgi:Protein of unknown function (DUF2914)
MPANEAGTVSQKGESTMSRMLQVLGLMVAVVVTGNAAEVVSIKIVPDGKAMNVITAIRASAAEEIYHVWIYSGKSDSGKVFVYDSAAKTMRTAEPAEMEWLKERKIVGARMIVKLPVLPSPGYHTRSQKTLDPQEAGLWKVQIYDSTNLKPIGETGFAQD